MFHENIMSQYVTIFWNFLFQNSKFKSILQSCRWQAPPLWRIVAPVGPPCLSHITHWMHHPSPLHPSRDLADLRLHRHNINSALPSLLQSPHKVLDLPRPRRAQYLQVIHLHVPMHPTW
jgi:hypothetical protein